MKLNIRQELIVASISFAIVAFINGQKRKINAHYVGKDSQDF